MCGICGIHHYRDGRPAEPARLAHMVQTMVHRGPDDSGLYVDGAAGIGMRRLSIIDLAGGAQPIRNEDGRIRVVCNGEIYNFQELRRELEARGHVFRTRSDTEVIVHGYEEWGCELLGRLNGMFGLAVLDSRDGSLLIARDPFGIKPLYYRDVDGTLLFGSEIKAILAYPGVRREVDLYALDEYLDRTFVPSPLTAFKDIRKLPAGHALRCNKNGVSVSCYSSPAPAELLDEPEAVVVERLREAVEAAVKRQMVSDVPIGVMLSGGVDSTAVATIMTQASGQPIETFTVGFTGDFAENELEYARDTAKRLGANHHEVILSPDDFADFLPRSIWYLEEPIATTSTLAFHKVCELAHEHVKVVLTGQGADEPFAGYARHFGEYYGRYYRAIPGAVRRGLLEPALLRLPRNERMKRAARSLGEMDAKARHAAVYHTMDPALRSRLWQESVLPGGSFAAASGAGARGAAAVPPMARPDAAPPAWMAQAAHLDDLSQMLFVDSRTSLPDNLLTYGDKMSMSVSLEARVPFLDLELMRLVESIPPRLKIRGRTQKYVLKKAVSSWVPRETIERKKIVFNTPVDQWFRDEWKDRTSEMLLGSGSACRQFFRPELLSRMLDEHVRGVHDHKRALFSLLTFELWHQQFIAPADWKNGT